MLLFLAAGIVRVRLTPGNVLDVSEGTPPSSRDIIAWFIPTNVS